jgi:putative flippase GtrA
MISKRNMKSLIKPTMTIQNVRSIVLFSLVGLSNTFVDTVVFFVLYHWFSHDYLLIQGISYSCGMVNSYLLNKYWTFQKKSVPSGAEILKFITVNALAFSVSFISLYILDSRYGFHMFFSKTFATIMAMGVNYTGSRLWVFKDAHSI